MKDFNKDVDRLFEHFQLSKNMRKNKSVLSLAEITQLNLIQLNYLLMGSLVFVVFLHLFKCFSLLLFYVQIIIKAKK